MGQRTAGSPGYRHRYSDQELARLKAMAGEAETYFMFNNIGMYEDALRLLALLSGQANFFIESYMLTCNRGKALNSKS